MLSSHSNEMTALGLNPPARWGFSVSLLTLASSPSTVRRHVLSYVVILN